MLYSNLEMVDYPAPGWGSGAGGWSDPGMWNFAIQGGVMGAGALSQALQTSPEGQLKINLSELANSAESALRANLAAYQGGQMSAADASARGYGILNDAIGRMLQAGPPGRISAAERDRRIDPGLLRWDWIAYYLDPIPNSQASAGAAPAAIQSASGVFTGGVSGSGLGGLFGDNNQLIVIAVVAALALVLIRSK